jgi:ribosomal protein S26
MASFLDLLDMALSPRELTASETQRVRHMLHGGASTSSAERPWASGVPDLVATAREQRSEVDDLRERVAWLELALKLVVDELASRGAVDGGELRGRLRTIAGELASERRAREATVRCVGCGASIPREEAHVRVTGTFCTSCHLGGKRGPAMTEVRVEDPACGYREAPRTELVEAQVSCVACGKQVPVSESYHSSRGALCGHCQAERED